jgi:hypothetical protein
LLCFRPRGHATLPPVKLIGERENKYGTDRPRQHLSRQMAADRRLVDRAGRAKSRKVPTATKSESRVPRAAGLEKNMITPPFPRSRAPFRLMEAVISPNASILGIPRALRLARQSRRIIYARFILARVLSIAIENYGLPRMQFRYPRHPWKSAKPCIGCRRANDATVTHAFLASRRVT